MSGEIVAVLNKKKTIVLLCVSSLQGSCNTVHSTVPARFLQTQLELMQLKLAMFGEEAAKA